MQTFVIRFYLLDRESSRRDAVAAQRPDLIRLNGACSLALRVHRARRVNAKPHHDDVAAVSFPLPPQRLSPSLCRLRNRVLGPFNAAAVASSSLTPITQALTIAPKTTDGPSSQKHMLNPASVISSVDALPLPAQSTPYSYSSTRHGTHRPGCQWPAVVAREHCSHRNGRQQTPRTRALTFSH